MNPFSLTGKTLLVTGASSGIGKAIAIESAEQGATLILTGRDERRLRETLSLLQGDGHRMIVADLTIGDGLNHLIEELPKLDGVVSNAGIVRPLVLALTEPKDIEDVMRINALVPIDLIRLIIQNKKLQKGASIVFVSSINGNQCSSVGSSLYAASKSALIGFMKAIALELAPRGIRVNAIQPGMIETDIFKDSGLSEEEFEQDKFKYPLRRYGKPEEVAYAALYLLSDATVWMTGSSIVLDGGYTLQ